MSHSLYMNRCFQLAGLGTGTVAPNPLVGAVLVYNNRIVAEGFHSKFGGPHAEILALNKITDPKIFEKAILYVNLEPCSHTGKTPPCTNLIIEKGIKQVVICNTDPFPKVNGSGIKQLERSGIAVTKNILSEEGFFLNRRFFMFHNKKRPFIILKWAETLNGFIAPLNKRGITWITNATSRLLVHRWRSEEQALLVGKGTVQNDNPELTVRGIKGNNPIRILIDTKLSLSSDYHIFDKKVPAFIFNFLKEGLEGNLKFIKVPKDKNFISNMLVKLYEENIQSVLVEGGATTLTHFINSGYWDEARVFTGQLNFDNGILAPVINGSVMEKHEVDGDMLTIYSNSYSN